MQKVKTKYRNGGMVEKNSVLGWIADIIIYALLVVMMFICVIPLWYSLVASFSDGFTLYNSEGMIWFPVGEWTLAGYEHVFASNNVLRGYLNTIIYVVGATLLGFVLNVLAGYVLSRSTRYRGIMILFVMFTMMFNGGLIPTYIVMRALGFVNSPLAIIIPTCTNAYFMILMMNAYLGVPQSTVEAAELDGAGHFRLMFQICLPQCMSIATVVLLYSVVFQWNSWFQAYVYLSTAREWWPLQLVVNNMISENTNFMQSGNIDYSRFLIQYGLVVVATIPILCVFPFFQKYIEKGAVLGGVKE